jgi:DNA-directed RNA polymerase specialized sigma24 family protein
MKKNAFRRKNIKTEPLSEWLRGAEGQAVVSRVACSMVWMLGSGSLSAGFLWHTAIPRDTPDELLKEIRSELLLFIIENKERLRTVLSAGNQNCHHYLRRAFVNHWIEKLRHPHRDPQRYLYKRAADVLRASDGFYTLMEKHRGLAFSMSPNSIPIPSLALEDVQEIAFPFRSVGELDYACVNKKKVLSELAAYFWNNVSQMWQDKPVRVALRDMIHWISLHVPMSLPTAVGKSHGEKVLPDILADDRFVADRIFFDPVLVRKWAQKFANRLSDKEKKVFYLRHWLGLSLKEIARKTGYKGSSGPKYLLSKADAELHFFLSDLPWLSPGDIHAEAFALFYDTLHSVLGKVAEG